MVVVVVHEQNNRRQWTGSVRTGEEEECSGLEKCRQEKEGEEKEECDCEAIASEGVQLLTKAISECAAK